MRQRPQTRSQGRPQGGSAAIVRAVLNSTLNQLGDRGFGALSIEEIATAAGVNKSSIYRRWPSKQDLVLAALQTMKEDAPIRSTGSLRKDLIRHLYTKAQTMTTSRGRKIARAIIAFDNAAVRNLNAALRETCDRVARGLIERAVLHGDLPPATDARFLSELLHGPIFTRILLYNERVTMRFVETVVDQILPAFGSVLDTNQSPRAT